MLEKFNDLNYIDYLYNLNDRLDVLMDNTGNIEDLSDLVFLQRLVWGEICDELEKGNG